jgi:hypothetical protein
MLMNATLRIYQTGPEEPNFTIVDIPGLVNGKQIDFMSIYYILSFGRE